MMFLISVTWGHNGAVDKVPSWKVRPIFKSESFRFMANMGSFQNLL